MSDASLPRPVRLPVPRALASDRLKFFLAAAIVFLSPFNVLRLPSVYFTASDVVTLLAFLALLMGGGLPLAPFGRWTPAWYAGYLALVGGMVIGGIANQRLDASADVIAQYTFALIILPWVLCGMGFARARRLLLVWAVTMVVVMLHGLYLMEVASDPPDNLVSGSGRLRGVLERETELGALGAVAIVVVLYLSAEKVLSRFLTLLFTMAILYGVILTASNTGAIALASGVVLFTLLQRSARHYVTMALVCALAVGGLLVGGESVLPDSFTRRVGGALSSGDLGQAGTFDDRMDLAREGWDVSQDHVLIGMGAEGFRVISSHGQPVHNTYVLLLVEGGVVSLAGLCAIVGVIALQGTKLLFDARTQTLGAMVVAIAIVYALVLNALPHVYARFFIVPLVLVMSLAVSDRNLRRTDQTPIRTE